MARDAGVVRGLVLRRLVDNPGGAEVGAVYDDLEGHEGYAMRRLPDGTVTSSWTVETAAFGSYVAACECDWRGGDHPPTSAGYKDAVDEWDRSHAQPLVARAVPGNVKRMLHQMKQTLADLVDERPAAGLKAVHEVEQWAKAIGARGMSGSSPHGARDVQPAEPKSSSTLTPARVQSRSGERRDNSVESPTDRKDVWTGLPLIARQNRFMIGRVGGRPSPLLEMGVPSR